MKRMILRGSILLLLLALFAGTALAADVFKFETKEIDIFENETISPTLVRDGAPAGEGTLTWTSSRPKIASVAEDGTITGLQKGTATITAKLAGEKKSWKATLTVNVLRRVTDVTLNTAQLKVYQATDPQVSELLGAETEHDVILLAAGKSAELRSTCTPSDASSKKVTYTSSDEGVLKITGNTMKALQAGECELTVASQQNPEVKEIFHVLVTQPVTKVTVDAEAKSVNVGERLTLYAQCEPDNATLTAVEWASRSPKVAEVDQNGTVTGLKKGSAVIEAKAADGSGKTGTFTVQVEQLPTGISFRDATLNLIASQSSTAQATVSPADAIDKSLRWSSSDESVATVNSQGRITAVGRGECVITATCAANPDVSATLTVNVIQRVTAIRFDDSSVSLPVKTDYQLSWTVEPADASIQDVTFSSNNKNVATVDAFGNVTGVSKGTAVITVKATDGSNRQGQIKVQVTQPVEGISIQYAVYHIQKGGSLNIKALSQPSNANNIAVDWTIEDESIATVTGNGKNVGTVRGRKSGTTTITGVTQDGGYTASAEIRVGDFNRAVVVDDVYLQDEQIRLVFRNRESFTVEKVYFRVECYDVTGSPLVCNKDGVSGSFSGYYDLELQPDSTTEHYRFTFEDYLQPADPICGMNVYITGWKDSEGYTRNIPEDQWPMRGFYRYYQPGHIEEATDEMVPTEKQE